MALVVILQNQTLTKSSETKDPESAVLAATTEAIIPSISDFTFSVNVPAKFSEGVIFNKDITAPNIVTSVNGDAGDVTVEFELTAGDGITVDGLKVTNSGIRTLSAGSGITVDGNKITNSGITSLTAGTGISVSGSTITSTITQGLTALSAGTGISVSGNEITNTGIISLLAGSGISISGSTITNSQTQLWTDSGGTTTSVNPTLIAPTGSGATSLIIRASTTAPGDIFKVTNSDGLSTFMSIGSTGTFTVNGSVLSNGLLESSGAIHLTQSANALVGTAIESGWTMNSNTFTYRRIITVTNNDGAITLPTNYEVTVSLSGAIAAQIYANAQSDCDDLRIAYNSTEIARNITSCTASSIVFTFLTQATINPSASSSVYYMYYDNSSLTAGSTYTGNVQLDSADDYTEWIANHVGETVSQETTIKQEGTGSTKIVATTGNFPTVVTTSQSQLGAAVSEQATALVTLTGTNYLYSIGGQNSGISQTGVYKSTVDGSGNVTAFSTSSQGQLSSGITAASVAATAGTSVDGGTGADGALDLASGCSGTGLSWNAGTSTCTISLLTKSIFNFTTINIPSGTTLTVTGPATTNTFFTMKATGSITIGGTINLNGKGYSENYGPGAGTTNSALSGGGGNGGAGGSGGVDSDPNLVAGGGTYSTDAAGSGGGSPSGSEGQGGGGIQLLSNGNITINTITANGANTSSIANGGGSGGTVIVKTDGAITISSSITANGGNGVTTALQECGEFENEWCNFFSGNGGGGRIVLQDSDGTVAGTKTVAAGSGGYGGNVGSITISTSPSNNNIYLIGGKTTIPQTAAYKASLDVSGNIGTWSTTSQNALPQALYNHTTNVLSSYLYTLGGNNGTSDQSTVYKSTISGGNVGTWSTTSQGQLPQALSEHTSNIVTVSTTNYIYVIGGLNGSTAQTTVYKATIDGSGNIGAFSTSSQGQLPSGVYGHTSILSTVNSTQYLYVLGGKNTAGTTQTTVYRAALDGSGNVGTWTTVAQNVLPQALYGTSGFSNTTSSVPYVYILGGHNGTSDQLTVYRGSLLDWSSYQVTNTITPVDLTNKNSLQYKVYSSVTGSPARLRISEDGVSYQTCTFTVSSANTWETKTCDISAVAAADKNAITKLQFDSSAYGSPTPLTFYFDDINALHASFAGSTPSTSGAGAILGAANLDVNAQGSGAVRINYDPTNALAGSGGLAVYNGSTAPLFTVAAYGLANATVGGLATYVKAGAISDTDFTDTAVNGMMGFDSTNGRIYFRYGGGWHYVAKTAGFQIPSEEAFAFTFNVATDSAVLGVFDKTKPLADGDFLLPFVEKHLEDGALHGLYTRFSDVKDVLFVEENKKIASLSAQVASAIENIQTKIISWANEFTTKKSHQEELCVGKTGEETCLNKDQIDKVLQNLPSPTPTLELSQFVTESASPSPSEN